MLYGILLCHLICTEPSSMIAASNALLVSILVIVIMLKTPSYPCHSWLPEAHVECTYAGSVILASIILKYSLAAVILFLPSDWSAPILLNVCWLLLVSISVSLISITCALDLKRLGAYLSILHMNSGLLILLFGTQDTVLAIDVLWTCHSITAFVYFVLIGLNYAQSGSRMLTAQVDADSADNHAHLWMSLLILNIGIPLGILFYPELIAAYLIASYNSVVLILIQYSLMVFTAYSLLSAWMRLLLSYDVRMRSNTGGVGVATSSFIGVQIMIPLILLATW